MQQYFSQKSRLVLPLLISATLASFSSISQAAQLEATADFSLGGGSLVQDRETGSVNIDILDSAANGQNDVFYHTFGDNSGNFGARVSGTNNFDITSSFSFSESFTNTGNVAQDFFFGFSIIPGEISTGISSSFKDNENLLASYFIEVILTSASGSSSIFDSAANIVTNDSGSTFTETGSTSLNGRLSTDNNVYSWDTFATELALGSFDVGESFSIDYLLTVAASGNIDGTSCDFADSDREGDIEFAVVDAAPLEAGIEGDVKGIEVLDIFAGNGCTALARSGDPLNVNDPANFVSVTSRASVPEPTSLLLFAIAIAGLGFTRRR